MRCPKCEFGNQDGSKFCGSCGQNIISVPPQDKLQSGHDHVTPDKIDLKTLLSEIDPSGQTYETSIELSQDEIAALVRNKRKAEEKSKSNEVIFGRVRGKER